jgi:NAD(P)-dependent dehydrogenase (short-subunit alcohol dehydrogenase family)
MIDFREKTVAITGGSGGIGLVTAEKLLALGARVILFDVRMCRQYSEYIVRHRCSGRDVIGNGSL